MTSLSVLIAVLIVGTLFVWLAASARKKSDECFDKLRHANRLMNKPCDAEMVESAWATMQEAIELAFTPAHFRAIRKLEDRIAQSAVLF